MTNKYLVSSNLLLVCTLLGYPNDKKSLFAYQDKPGTYQSMDYGPVVAESVKMNWLKNSLVRKGLVIRLNHNAAMIFDTDLMRFAAGIDGNGYL